MKLISQIQDDKLSNIATENYLNLVSHDNDHVRTNNKSGGNNVATLLTRNPQANQEGIRNNFRFKDTNIILARLQLNITN